MTLAEFWPLFGLRLTTPDLTLRVPTDDDLEALIELASRGIHDPASMPFATPWTDLASPEFEQGALQYWWGARADFSPQKWDLALAVFRSGRVIGVQNLMAADFPRVRSAETGSWLGLAHQGQGFGKQMRRAVLDFGFRCLGADEIISTAFVDNLASQGVSLAVGYEPNGLGLAPRRDGRGEQRRFRIDRARWQATPPGFEITIDGFDPCRPLFGLAADDVA